MRSLCQARDKVNLRRCYLPLKDSSYPTSVLCLIFGGTVWWSWQLKALTSLLTVSYSTRPGFQIRIAFVLVKAVHSLSDDECPGHSVRPDFNSRKLPCSPDWLTSHRERLGRLAGEESNYPLIFKMKSKDDTRGNYARKSGCQTTLFFSLWLQLEFFFEIKQKKNIRVYYISKGILL